jgi:predicted nuclease of predicted toxin-antitoxin system
MKILLDHCTPATLRRHLASHEVKTARQMNWNGLDNGDLLREAQQQFDVMISTDSNIKYQQNLINYEIGLIVLRGRTNALPSLMELLPELLELLPTVQPGEVHYLFTREMLFRKEDEYL